MPSTSVYFVSPRRMAAMAASLTFSGVSKSGSPAPSPITSRPSRFSSRARAVPARVAEGLTRARAADCRLDMATPEGTAGDPYAVAKGRANASLRPAASAPGNPLVERPGKRGGQQVPRTLLIPDAAPPGVGPAGDRSHDRPPRRPVRPSPAEGPVRPGRVRFHQAAA